MALPNAQKTSHRAKFAYVKRNDIEKLINSGQIDANDIVYTKDTHENIFIAPDLSIISVKSKIYRFLDVSTAEKELNASSDTYSGQIVAILSDGAYTAYIVNKNSSGSFYVTRLSEDAKTLNYDSLGNRPIENLDGTLDNPITVSELESGVYKIRGQYKLCPEDITTYLSANDNIFLVNKSDTNIAIRKITATDIFDYSVAENAIKSQSAIPTKQWIEEKGYVTESVVNEKIAALDFITKDEVSDYVKQVISENIEPIVDARIEKKFNESFEKVEDSDISKLF